MRYAKWIVYVLVVGTLIAPTVLSQSPSYAAPPTKTPPPTASCYKPQSVTTQISGYVEGNTGNKNTTINGKEIVYNLVTFQREEFSFKAQMSTSGKNLGSYVGYVQGFTTNQNAPNDMGTFNSQYATQFLFTSEPANAPIWAGFNSLANRQGTVHFATAADVTPTPAAAVSGDQAYLDVTTPRDAQRDEMKA